MARIDRLHYLTTLFNIDILNEIDRVNEYKTYHPVLGVGTKVIPLFLRTKPILLKIYVLVLAFLYPIYGLFFPIKATICKLGTTRVTYKGNKLFLLATIALPRVVKNAGIKWDDNDYWLELPWAKNNDISNERVLSVFSLISLFDLWIAYFDSISVVYYASFIKGYKYIPPTLKSYQWLLYDRAIRRIPHNTELIFANHKDSYSHLIDCLPHSQKTLIQHGTEILLGNPFQVGPDLYDYYKQYHFWATKMPVRYKSVSTVYCFTEKERVALSSAVLNCNPEVKYVGYNLKEFNLNTSGNKAILIVGYSEWFLSKESFVISKFQNTGITIYLKNHPTLPSSAYKDIQNKYNFILLEGAFFPKVDVVFSYYSTLALEYEALGVQVILYEGVTKDHLDRIVSKVINEINN